MKHLFSIIVVLFVAFTVHAENKNFVFIMPARNCAQWYKKNLDSVFCQTYTNYRIIYIDDHSDDGTPELVQQYITECGYADRFTMIINQERKGALENRWHAARSCDDDDEIIFMLDGDDWLSCDLVLSQLNDLYQDPDVWFAYGNQRGWCRFCDELSESPFVVCTKQCKHKANGCGKLPSKEKIDANKWRQYLMYWPIKHPRSFYAWLFKCIKKDDLLGENGQFYFYNTDIATTVPLLEMAGHHVRFVPDILYIYNQDGTPSERAASRQERSNFGGGRFRVSTRLQVPYKPLREPIRGQVIDN